MWQVKKKEQQDKILNLVFNYLKEKNAKYF